jgi:hypothetical protein
LVQDMTALSELADVGIAGTTSLRVGWCFVRFSGGEISVSHIGRRLISAFCEE